MALRKYSILMLGLLAVAFTAQAKKPAPKAEAPKPAVDTLTYEVRQTNDWVFYAPQTPRLEIAAVNNGRESIVDTLTLQVTTDDKQPLYRFAQRVTLAAGQESELSFSFAVPAPGFYRCRVTDRRGFEIKQFNIGYEPEFIVSLCDAQPDLKEFWDRAKAELAQVEPEYELTPLPEKSNEVRNIYQVRMKSLGGETIQGYYATPVKEGKYPAIISYMGYGSEPWCPDPNNPDYVEFVLSTRGQGLNQPDNKYGTWILYGLDSPENFYYRGAFMDVIRAIDFVCSREEVRREAIFAEGGSQGGAFTLVACALDDRIAAAAPFIPFLSDYPDYFRIGQWPGNQVLRKAKELRIDEASLYRTLSYFDIKNLAPWIKCPIMMGVGLQDPVCPPHTNFSGYNRISSEKCYRIYPTMGHDVGKDWWPLRSEFFKKHTR